MTHTAADQLHLFGTPQWRSAGAARHDLPDSLPGYLVAYLAYRSDWVPREVLAGLFWPDRADDEAQHNLRANLHRVRRLLAGWGAAESLQAERRRVRLSLPTDVAALRTALGRADWAAAAALHGLPLLAGLSFRGFALPHEWAQSERRVLADAVRDAGLRAALAHESAGDVEAAALGLLRLLQADAGTEDAVQALLRVAAAAGRRDEALAAFEQFRQWLHAELGLQPMPQTQALADRLRSGRQTASASPAIAATAPGAPAAPRAVIQPPQLVGRDAERALLAGPALLVAVGGEPGVGKTRLLEDALPQARWVACREGLVKVALAPLIEYLHDFRDTLPLRGDLRLDLARLLPELAAGELLPPADPAAGQARLLDALARVLEDGQRPLVFDDLQWADAATAELVLLLARRARVPLRLAHRNTEVAPALDTLLDLLDGAGLRRVALAPLSAETLQAWLAQLSHSNGGPPRFSAWLHARTGGNPFFALQTLRALFENGRLAATADGWSSDLDAVTLDYTELEVPPRVADLVRRRLRGLSDSARRVLGVVAVCGSARDVERIAATVGLSSWAAAEALAEAEAAGLLREGRFVHDLVRESHVASLAEPLRVVLHGAVARQFADAMPPAQVAEHWWAAGQVTAALDATLRAVDAARLAGLQAQALGLLQQAAHRVQNLGADRDDPAAPAARSALGADGVQALCARLDAVRAQVCLERADLDAAAGAAQAVLEAPAAPVDRATAWRTLAAVAMQRGRLDEAAAALHEAALAAPESVDLLIERCNLAQLQGRVAEVVPALEARRDRLRREQPGLDLLRSLTSLGAAYDDLGDATRGLLLHEEAYRLAQRLGARYAQVEVAVNLLWALSALQRNAEGIAIAQEALALGDYDATPVLRNNLAWSLTEVGRLAEACTQYEALADSADPSLALIARARLLDLYHRLGRADEAPAMAARVVAGLGSTQVGLAHAAAAINLLQHGDDAQAQAALAALQPTGLDPWLRERLQAALRARGFDPAAYLPDATAATAAD